MQPEECPLPDVAEALAPFIRPRDEVVRIRQALHGHLQKQIQTGDARLTAANLTTAREGQPPGSSSAALSGVRKAYLKALQAHTAAQAKYDSLKADLARLSGDNNRTDAEPKDALVNESYIPLLRQRERHRKLLVLQRTFSQVIASGQGVVDGHLDDVVRQKTGDLPVPPTTQPSSLNDKADFDGRILHLRKAVLITKRNVDELASTGTSTRANEPGAGETKGEIAGLQSALNVLTSWMERQLAIIGGGEGEAQSVPPTPGASTHPSPSEVFSLDDIEVLYKQYLAARQRLIEIVNHPPNSAAHAAGSASASEDRTSSLSDKPTPAETLLPYISTLVSDKQQEAALLQQHAHFRRVMSAAEEDQQRLMARVADESHLVQPGAARGRDWADAAAETSQATEAFASQKVRAGEEHASNARKTLQEIEGMPALFEGLTGKS